MPAAVTANPAASGTRTPAWSIMWVAACTPAAIAPANGRNASPVGSAPCRARLWRYSEASRKAPNMTAEAAGIITRPPPIARSVRRWTRRSGCRVELQRGEDREAGEGGGADDDCPGGGPARGLGRVRAYTRPARLAWRPARRGDRGPPARPLGIGRMMWWRRRPVGRRSEVDEEDRRPVDELGPRAPGGRRWLRRRRRRRPRRRAPWPAQAVERGGDDRQRGRGEHRGAQALRGAGGEQHGHVARQRGH